MDRTEEDLPKPCPLKERCRGPLFLSGARGRGGGGHMVCFLDFCLKQGIFSWRINSLRLCSTCQTTAPRDSVDRAVINSFVIANGLNKKVSILLLYYTGYDFGLNALNRVSKIGILISDFRLKQGQGMRGRAAPPHPRYIEYPRWTYQEVVLGE